MAKPLIIVESPAKAKTIEKFLGRKYRVKASVGHVIDLPKSQLGVDVDDDFKPKYITIRGKTKVLAELRAAAKEGGQVLLATDPDREGEAIAWHLANALDLGDCLCRITFHEITAAAVTEAVKQPRRVDTDRVNAQQARRILDRLVGYKLSPLLWRKVQRGLSAGRVQSVAVRLVVDREQEIRAFKPEEYWSLTAWLRRQQDDVSAAFPARLVEHHGKKIKLGDRDAAAAALAGLDGAAYRVTAVERKQRRRQPALPFTTSTLQQEASRRHGFGARRTMQAAQQLYEGLDLGTQGRTGLITYMRTDSTRVAAEAVAQARQYIEGRYGAEYLARGRRPAPSPEAPGVQGAHEAIRPTSVERTPESVSSFLGPDQARLYRLIWERFVASQMAAAVYDAVSADIAAKDYLFRATGQTVKFPGFQAVYTETREEQGKEDEEERPGLPELTVGQLLDLVRLEDRQHFTQPPPRYSEATLVRALEELGIGRPSTYAPIIETIQQRNYVVQEARRFMPTPLGETVTELLRTNFPSIVDVNFTAGMETQLDQVERGQADWVALLRGFYGPFAEAVSTAEHTLERVKVPVETSDVVCDKCGTMMVVRHGRFGPFLACPNFPACRNTKPLVKKVDAHCPLCGGAILEKKSKQGRKFYGCENYPQCTFTTWNKPLAQKCPKCDSFLVQKRTKAEGTRYVCSNEQCDYVTDSLRRAGAAGDAYGESGDDPPGEV